MGNYVKWNCGFFIRLSSGGVSANNNGGGLLAKLVKKFTIGRGGKADGGAIFNG